MDYHCLRIYVARLACICLSALILCVPAFAVEADQRVVEESVAPDVVYLLTSDVSELLIEESESLMPMAADDGFPFYGSAWLTGTVSGLGEVSLYFPIDRRDGYLGLDSSGYLFNVSDDSFSGVMIDESGTQYTVSFGTFATPRYRVSSGSSYSYNDLYFSPDEGNVVLPGGPAAVYSPADLLPYVGLLLLGGIFVCCMRKL